jgi:DNA topoisomerase 2-associated protein PAT1
MSFFGFEQGNLEQERFNSQKVNKSNDVAVYTFGEEGYDGLGDLLQEGGDELNDETFGGVDSIGEGILLRL